ncbi:MAG: DNA repair protein RadC [Tidjanibacter sp.]|nr:DNA repair protein RadC [Tidjanibacter sp.]
MKSPTDRDVRDLFVARGAEALDDAELVSLMFPPKRGEESVAVASRLVERVGSLGELAKLSLDELRLMEGLGLERAARLSAAMEFGRRVLVSQMEEQTTIHDRNDVEKIFAPLLGGLDHEELWVVYLSSANRIIERRKVGVGGLSSVVSDCRLILRRALNLVAASIIVVHNHPSGSAQPSGDDEAFTRRLKEAAALFDIALLDHIIIARGGSFSFRSAGKL